MNKIDDDQKTESISVRVSKKAKARLEAIARREKRSLSQVLDMWLRGELSIDPETDKERGAGK